MKLLELRLNGFGRFQRLNLTLPARFGLIVGPNESGKTTVVDAVVGALFGYRRAQKHLRENYRPWHDSGNYRAALVLSTDSGLRYLVGRDFDHNRLEVFRGQGVRLEPMAEGEWELVLRETLGLNAPHVFENTSLIRQTEPSLHGRLRAVAGAVASVSNFKLTEEECARAQKAMALLRDKLAGTGPEIMELEGRLSALDEELRLGEAGERRYVLMAAEERRLALELDGLLDEAGTAQWKPAAAGEREKLETAPDEVDPREPAADMAGADPMNAAIEELSERALAFEVELRFAEEALSRNSSEAELLEEEIKAIQAKLENVDENLFSPETQERLAGLMQETSRHEAKLESIRPELERNRRRLANLTRWRWLGFGLGVLVAAAAAFSWIYLPISRAWILTGLTGYLLASSAVLAGRSARLRAKMGHQVREIEEREMELARKKQETGNLLAGKNYLEYQAELAAGRLYRNDLWELEQTLSKKRSERESVRREDLAQKLAETRLELENRLKSSGCRDMEEWRSSLGAGERPQEEESSSPVFGEEREEHGAGDPRIEVLREELAKKRAELRDLRMSLARDRVSMEEDGRQLRTRLAKARQSENGARIALECLEKIKNGAEDGLPAGLQEETGRILSEMTGGRYQEVNLALAREGLEVRVRAAGGGAWIEPSLLSTGTIDQLYLALRAALAHRALRSERPPLILDDPFASLDRSRLAGTARVLARLSEEHQVIWLTKDPDLAGLIEEATGERPEVVELPG